MRVAETHSITGNNLVTRVLRLDDGHDNISVEINIGGIYDFTLQTEDEWIELRNRVDNAFDGRAPW